MSWDAKCTKPLCNKMFQDESWKEDEREILLKPLSEMVSPHPVMERADC
jgi:hypothetical protein